MEVNFGTIDARSSSSSVNGGKAAAVAVAAAAATGEGSGKSLVGSAGPLSSAYCSSCTQLTGANRTFPNQTRGGIIRSKPQQLNIHNILPSIPIYIYYSEVCLVNSSVYCSCMYTAVYYFEVCLVKYFGLYCSGFYIPCSFCCHLW